jgi:hypothetical protein
MRRTGNRTLSLLREIRQNHEGNAFIQGARLRVLYGAAHLPVFLLGSHVQFNVWIGRSLSYHSARSTRWSREVVAVKTTITLGDMADKGMTMLIGCR